MQLVTETKDKKNKIGKNKKKAWRKQVDISDIEKILEDVRREERYGGPLEEQKDEEFMLLDLPDDDEAEKKEEKKKKKNDDKMLFTLDTGPGAKKVFQDLKGFKPSKRGNTEKPLKCFAALEGLQGAKVSIIPGNKAKITPPEEKKEIPTKVVNKYKKKVRHIQNAIIQDKDVRHEAKVSQLKDAWDDSLFDPVAKQCIEKGVKDNFDEDIATYYKEKTKLLRAKVPVTYHKKPSALAAVQLPKAGFSYNPEPKDHKEVLQDAANWIKKKRQIEADNYTCKEMVNGTHALLTGRKNWKKVMSEGLPVLNGKMELPSNVYRVSVNDEGGLDGTLVSKAVHKKKPKAVKKPKQQVKKAKAKAETIKVKVKNEHDEEEETLADDGEEETVVDDDEVETTGEKKGNTPKATAKVKGKKQKNSQAKKKTPATVKTKKTNENIKGKVQRKVNVAQKKTVNKMKTTQPKTNNAQEGQKGTKRKRAVEDKSSTTMKKIKVENKQKEKIATGKGTKTTTKKTLTVPAKGKKKATKTTEKGMKMTKNNRKTQAKKVATKTIRVKGRKVKLAKGTLKKEIKTEEPSDDTQVKKPRKTILVNGRKRKLARSAIKEEIKTEKEEEAVIIKKTKERKTQKQRKKEQEKKHLESLKTLREKAVERQEKVELIPQYLKAIEKKKKVSKAKLLKRQKEREERKSKPHRLAQKKFLEEDVDVALPQQLPGSLRQINSAGDLSRQCVMHFQRRNMLPPERLYRMPNIKNTKRYLPRRYKEKVANGMKFGLVIE